MFVSKVAKPLAKTRLGGNMLTNKFMVAQPYIMNNKYIKAINGGVLELKKLGFKTVMFSPTFPLKEPKATKKRFTVLNDTNPLCVRLLEIIATDKVIQGSLEIDDGSLVLKVDKPKTINDAFFSIGYIIIGK